MESEDLHRRSTTSSSPVGRSARCDVQPPTLHRRHGQDVHGLPLLPSPHPACVPTPVRGRRLWSAFQHRPRPVRVRHSNFIERSFGETHRRVKVIGRLPGEHSCLSLVWAVLDRASAGWRGFTITPAGLRLLHDLRRSLHDPPTSLPRRNSANHSETTVASTDSAATA